MQRLPTIFHNFPFFLQHLFCNSRQRDRDTECKRERETADEACNRVCKIFLAWQISLQLIFNLISFTFLALSHSKRKLWQITFDAASKMSFDTHKYLICALQRERERDDARDVDEQNGNKNGKISSYGKFKWQAKYS